MSQYESVVHPERMESVTNPADVTTDEVLAGAARGALRLSPAAREAAYQRAKAVINTRGGGR